VARLDTIPWKLSVILTLLLAAAFILQACSCESKDDDGGVDNDNDDTDDDDNGDDTAEGWYIYEIDSEGYAEFTSIAIDSNNKVHISYSYTHAPEMGVRYATNMSGSWEIFDVEIAPWSGFHTSIAVDSGGKAHISYHDMGTHPEFIEYATNGSGSWQVVGVGEVGFSTDMMGMNDIALDSSDRVHIAYYYCGDVDPYDDSCLSGDLKYATNGSGSWQIFTIDSEGDTGWYPSIAMDSNGKVHISYVVSEVELLYITNRTSTWQRFEVAAGSDMGRTSIALDSGDKVHLSYHSNGDLMYATNASGEWQVFTIQAGDDMGHFNSIAVDSRGGVHIAYNNGVDKDLRYATNSSGEWEILTIDSGGDAGRYCSIAVDSDDYVHISYYYFETGDNAHGDLKYATNRPQR